MKSWVLVLKTLGVKKLSHISVIEEESRFYGIFDFTEFCRKKSIMFKPKFTKIFVDKEKSRKF